MDAHELLGRRECPASPVIGSVEVFEAKTVSGPITASIRPITSALTRGSSNTASITRSQPASAP